MSEDEKRDEDRSAKLKKAGVAVGIGSAAIVAALLYASKVKKPKRGAVVEDTVTGAMAGVAAGATVFGYSTGESGHSGPEALRSVGAQQVFSDMKQLPALLAAHGLQPA